MSRRYGYLVDQSLADLGRDNPSESFRRTEFDDQASVCLEIVCCIDIDIGVAQAGLAVFCVEHVQGCCIVDFRSGIVIRTGKSREQKCRQQELKQEILFHLLLY